MAEMLASAVVKAAGNKLGAILAGEAGLLWNLREDLVFMRDTLESIQARLRDAERRSMANNESVTVWLRHLKSAAYDIEDMLEEFTATNPREQGGGGVEDDHNWFVKVSLFCSSLCFSLSPSHISMAHNIKKMRQRLKAIQDRAGITGFNFSQDTKSHEDEVISIINRRDTIADINEDIVGRDTEKEQIISALLAGSGDHVTVIAIHGFGGLGKTTLVKLAYNDATVVKYFDLRAWVYVSMKYDMMKIGKSILSQVDKSASSTIYDALEPLKQDLKTKLGDKKLLIVLDDLWEEDGRELGRLMAFLNACAKGGKVMVTTRKLQIATKMQPVLSHRLEILSEEQCWELFKQKAFSPGEDVDADVETIARELAKMCGGVPLAIRSLGSTMLFKGGVRAWELMRDSDIWKMDGEGSSGILPSLWLSFYHLPSHLKPCFAYCSVFSKGCEIDKDLLIQQWIAMGFIQSTNRRFLLEELGEEYVKELMEISFLEASRIPSFSVGNKHLRTPRLFQMHDLIHDLAISAAGEEFLLSDFEVASREDSRRNNCRYAVLANYSDTSTIFKSVPSTTRSLHFRNCEQLQLPKKSLSKFLRVLNLSGCPNLELLTYITHQLKLLKFLDASCLQNPVPPEHLSSLCSLHALNLSHSTLGSLPSNMGNLSKLHYLNLRGCSHLSELPESFVQLKYLLHLDLSKCSGLHSLPTFFGHLSKLSFLDLSGCSKLKMLPDTFQHLTCLETLNLSYCHELQKLPSLFGKLGKLHILDLSDCQRLHELPESLCEISSLEYLSLSCCPTLVELPECFGGLRHLRVLNLSDCHELLVLPESFTCLMNLEELILSGCWELKELPALFGDLCKLRFLDLSCCVQLSVLPESLSKLINLEYLDLSCCIALWKIHGNYGNLKKLKVLNISYCSSSIQMPDGIAKMCGLKSLLAIGMIVAKTSNKEDRLCLHGLMQHRSLISFNKWDIYGGNGGMAAPRLRVPRLEVTGLSMVRSIEKVAELELHKRHYLQRLELAFADDGAMDRGGREDAVVLEKLLPPRTLEQFALEGYNCVELPFWMRSVTSYLPNLVHLQICNLERCDSLPPLGQLPKLLGLKIGMMPNLRNVGMEFSGGHKSFLKLRVLTIEHMRNLEEWHISRSNDGGGKELVFPNLQRVDVRCCPNLKFVPFLPQCLSLDIRSSDVVMMSEWPSAPLSHMATIQQTSQGSAKLTSSPIQKLVSKNLVELSLCDMELIDHLPPLGQLPKLRRLRIQGMPNIRQVGSDFSRDSSPFPRLRILEIWVMLNLEEWHTRQSTNDTEEHIFPVLEELSLHRCPRLRFVPFLPPCISKCIIEFSDEVLLSGQHNWPPSYHLPTSQLQWKGDSAGLTGLQYFTALKTLEIACIEREETMSSLGESIKCLTSLESLQMSWCKVGGEWLGSLNSLRSLSIKGCSLPLDFVHLRLPALETLELDDYWEAIKVLSEGEVQSLVKQIPNVTISYCGPVEEAKWKNGVLTDCSFWKINKSEWQDGNYDDAGWWPTILPGWPKGPDYDDGESEDDDDSEYEGDDSGTEDDHSGTEDEAGPSGTK